MIKKLSPEQIAKNKRETSEAAQRIFRETAGKTFSAGKQALEGIEEARAGSMDLAQGNLSGAMKIVKPFFLSAGGGLKMSYGKSAANKIFKSGAPAPGPAPAQPKVPGEK